MAKIEVPTAAPPRPKRWRGTRPLGIDPLRGWALAVTGAGVVALVLPPPLDWEVRAIAGWDAGVLTILGPQWWMILRANPERTRERAAVEDPGRLATLAIALLSSVVGLVAAVVLRRRPQDFAPAGQDDLLIGLGIVAVVGAWALMHTAFALHYAHLYYVDDGTPGGLEFAGGPPADLDFAYFAFMIGMALQGADVVVSHGDMRRVVLGHALLAFVFNTTILALAINLIFGRLQ